MVEATAFLFDTLGVRKSYSIQFIMNKQIVNQQAETQPEPDSTVPIPGQPTVGLLCAAPRADRALGVSTLSTDARVQQSTGIYYTTPATETSRGLRTGHRWYNDVSGTKQSSSGTGHRVLQAPVPMA